MHLSDFIQSHIEQILNDWEALAQTQPFVEVTKSATTLRTIRKQILINIAHKIDQHTISYTEPTLPIEDADDSNERVVNDDDSDRSETGFTLSELVTEYRWLTATVLDCWKSNLPSSCEDTVAEILRFNSIVDQTLNDALASCSRPAETLVPIKKQNPNLHLIQLSMDGVYTLSLADLHMNLLTHKVSRGDTVVALQPREFKLLEYMMRHSNQVLSRSLMLKHVWNYQFDPQTNFIEVHISKLRKKIDANSKLKLLHTVRNRGYTLSTEVS